MFLNLPWPLPSEDVVPLAGVLVETGKVVGILASTLGRLRL